MINFNFNLSEEDAQNFCDIINNNIVKYIADQIEPHLFEFQTEQIKEHVQYLKDMQKTIESSIKKVP